MSDISYKVPYTNIVQIETHPNAHSLDIAKVYDWSIVVQKNKYKVGDKVIFIPSDSILPNWIEEKLFPSGSKITLQKSRIRQIRIRGVASQGMLIDPKDILDKGFLGASLRLSDLTLEDDLSETLGIKKYEPPVRTSTPSSPIKRNKPKENKYFHKYSKPANLKWYPELFKEDEMISVTEKGHGTNARFGWVPNYPKNILQHILKFFKLLPSYEFVFGSHNVQLQEKPGHKTFYEENVYERIANEYDMKTRLLPGEVVYGEIVGPGIQQNYHYDVSEGDLKLVLFDLKIQTENSSHYVDVDHFQQWCKDRHFEYWPELYRGVYNKDVVYSLTKGDSVYAPGQKVREGCVVKPLIEEPNSIVGRKLLKVISEDYLADFSNTDEH